MYTLPPPDHRVGLNVGVDDVDDAVDRELIRVDGIRLAVCHVTLAYPPWRPG